MTRCNRTDIVPGTCWRAEGHHGNCVPYDSGDVTKLPSTQTTMSEQPKSAGNPVEPMYYHFVKRKPECDGFMDIATSNADEVTCPNCLLAIAQQTIVNLKAEIVLNAEKARCFDLLAERGWHLERDEDIWMCCWSSSNITSESDPIEGYHEISDIAGKSKTPLAAVQNAEKRLKGGV